MVLTEHDIDRIRKNGVIGRKGNLVKRERGVTSIFECWRRLYESY